MMARLSKLSTREKTWVLLAAGVLFLVLGDLFVRRPLRDDLRALAQRTEAREKKLVENQLILSPEVKVAVLKDWQSFGGYLVKRASTAEENAAMLSAIEALASRAGVGLVATKPQPPTPESFYEEYGVDLEVEGDMSALVSFLYGLQTSPQVLRVARLAIEAKGGGDPAALKGLMTISKVVML
jgi:Tfp pilus assembly protein PilO